MVYSVLWQEAKVHFSQALNTNLIALKEDAQRVSESYLRPLNWSLKKTTPIFTAKASIDMPSSKNIYL